MEIGRPWRGVEFATSSGRCEIWLREGGILASNSVSGHECWRYVDPNGGSHLPNETTTLMPHQLSLWRKQKMAVFFVGMFFWVEPLQIWEYIYISQTINL